jgi:carbon monoxide dehydrogenase subunit G
MELDHAFSIAAPRDAVWRTITDIERVAPCVPNTRVRGPAGEGSYSIEITAVVGPLTVTTEGTITLVERDDAAHREVLKVVVSDPDGDALADAMLTIVLTQSASATDAAVHSSVEVGGIATLVAESTLNDVAQKTLTTFAANLAALLKQAPGAP